MTEGAIDILSVVGARPNFMKVAPLAWAFAALPRIRHRIVHTGQHYDDNMSGRFFRDLGIAPPDVNLGVGSASHARQTAEIMVGFEKVLLEARPDVVVVVGDVNSTLACAITAAKLLVPVAHVEAGLRSFDRTMPEEVNRVVTDAVSDLLFVTEPSGVENLRREGVPDSRVHLVGNVMIDALLRCRNPASDSKVLERLAVEPGGYGVVTLHRPSNVDDPAKLAAIVDALSAVSRECPLVFPVHPRTRARLDALRPDLNGGRLILVEPLGYLDFLALEARSRLILTDSGGIQEEALVLGVPCLTLRDNTERPITVALGMNKLVGSDMDALRREALAIVRGPARRAEVPPYWDGKAAERIAAILVERFGGRRGAGGSP